MTCLNSLVHAFCCLFQVTLPTVCASFWLYWATLCFFKIKVTCYLCYQGYNGFYLYLWSVVVSIQCKSSAYNCFWLTRDEWCQCKKRYNELIKWENFCRFSRYCWLPWKDKMLQILIKMKESMPEIFFFTFFQCTCCYSFESIKHW